MSWSEQEGEVARMDMLAARCAHGSMSCPDSVVSDDAPSDATDPDQSRPLRPE